MAQGEEIIIKKDKSMLVTAYDDGESAFGGTIGERHYPEGVRSTQRIKFTLLPTPERKVQFGDVCAVNMQALVDTYIERDQIAGRNVILDVRLAMYGAKGRSEEVAERAGFRVTDIDWLNIDELSHKKFIGKNINDMPVCVLRIGAWYGRPGFDSDEARSEYAAMLDKLRESNLLGKRAERNHLVDRLDACVAAIDRWSLFEGVLGELSAATSGAKEGGVEEIDKGALFEGLLDGLLPEPLPEKPGRLGLLVKPFSAIARAIRQNK